MKHIQSDEIKHLRDQFVKMDLDRTGFISAKELQKALKQVRRSLSAAEISKIIDRVDHARNGKINYSEFLAATICASHKPDEDTLWGLFKHFDIDDSDEITDKNIRELFKMRNKNISDS